MWYRHMNTSAMWGVHNNLWGFVLPIVLIDLVLRGYALWRSARAGQQWWFVALLIVNSLGILPAIYLFLNRDTAPTSSKPKTHTKKSSKS